MSIVEAVELARSSGVGTEVHMRLHVATDVEEVHRIASRAEAHAGTGVAAEVQVGGRIVAEPQGLEGSGLIVELGLGIDACLDKDHRLAGSDAACAEDWQRHGVGVGVVIHRPARDVHGGGAIVGHFEPVGSKGSAAVAAGPRSHFGDDEVRCGSRAIGDGQGVRRASVRSGSNGGIVHIDGDGVGGLRRCVERRASFEEQGCANDLEGSSIRTGDRQGVWANAVIGDVDVGDADVVSDVWKLRESADHRCKCHSGRGGVCRGGQRVNPKLRMIEVATAIFVSDVEVAGAVHANTFHGHGRNGQGAAGIGYDGEAAINIAAAVAVDNLARLLADDEEMAGFRGAG